MVSCFKPYPKNQQEVLSCSDIELLACLLQPKRRGTQSLAEIEGVYREYGGLRGILRAPFSMLSQSLNRAPIPLYLAQEVCRRASLEQLKRSHALTSPQLTRQYLLAELSDMPYEVFSMLLLDTQHRVMRFHQVSQGTINTAAIYPREVVKTVLEINAAAVILVHNHPSGLCEPSHADKVITERLVKALKLIDVRVLDHIVVGETQICSFAERGWIR